MVSCKIVSKLENIF